MTFANLLHRRGALSRLSAIGALAAALTLPAAAATFPTQTVRIIVPFTPGAAPDVIARVMAESLGRQWGVTTLVENKVGADGAIAGDAVAKAPANGHTLYLGTMGSLALLPATAKALPYDGGKAFRGVSLVAKNPFAILVGSETPLKSVSELATLSKTHPLTYGSAGTLGPLIGSLIAKRINADLLYVPYKGAQPALIDLAGGRLDMVIADVPSLLVSQRQGRGRLLVLTSSTRSSLAPEVPTMEESGFRDFDFSTWYAVVVPAATSDEVVASLSAALSKTLADPAVVKQLSVMGMTPSVTTPAQTDKLLHDEMARWKSIVASQ